MDVLEEGDRVVFLRPIVPGGADRSYGIHVAGIAGMPRAVVRRAREILDELEQSAPGSDLVHRRATMRTSPPAATDSFQLTLFGEPHPVVEELKALDIEALSPLEAITKLFELQREANG
jgi:DNA mismatch repair protein MutS